MAEKKIYAGYPTADLLEGLEPKSKRHKLLWGDTMIVAPDSPAGGPYVKVTCRGLTGHVLRSQTQPDHLLDLIFLDVGQGDSAVLVTPRGQRVLIDFGQSDNTFRYLRWRYRDLKEVPFAAAILSHADEDHYGGLERFCREGDRDAAKFRFATLFHSGLVDTASPSVGGYYTNLETDRARFEDACRRAGEGKRKGGPAGVRGILQRALACGRIGDLRSLSADDGELPGLEPTRDFRIEVLGPLRSRDAEGQPRLAALPGGFNKTKNGHSVVLKITYGKVRIMLGGDLNSPAQKLLLAHYGDGLEGPAAIAAARRRLEVDVAKAFHHGSDVDTRPDFFQAMNPVATVISSGDDEAHSHPRADALGTIGKHSRGPRPLIFCTELARSSGDLTRHPQVRQKLAGKAPATGRTARARDRELDRAISRYGAINLRTDGRRMLFAQRVERGNQWDVYELVPDKSGEWKLAS